MTSAVTATAITPDQLLPLKRKRPPFGRPF
jgi:hypothetical protein